MQIKVDVGFNYNGELIMKTYFVLIVILFMGVQSSAQDFETWKKQQMEQFQQFKDERDKAFNAMLKQAWQAVNIEKGEPLIKEPKIVVQPEVKPEDTIKPTEIVEIKVDSVISVTVPEEKAPEPPKLLIKESTPVPEPAQRVAKPVNTAVYPFYTVQIELPSSPKWKSVRVKQINPDGISNFYQALSNTDYEPFLRTLDEERHKLKLNDWAFGQLIETTVSKTTQASLNDVRLFTWFFLLKAGYDVKIGYNNDEIYLLIPTQQRLFGTNYFTINGIKYYVVDFQKPVQGSVRLYTYKGSFPDANRALDMRFNAEPEIKTITEPKKLTFTYDGKQYEVFARYNSAYVDMVKYYPQTDLTVYFQTMVSGAASESLIEELKSIVADKDEYTQVNMILRFVQTAFEYKTDQDQFGKEKYFFGDETLHYPYSDCEDRSILFASLVKKITGLPVIGVKYPGHLATAVAFSIDTKGDKLFHGGKSYTICDPTYKGADIGMSMPKFKSQSITIVPF